MNLNGVVVVANCRRRSSKQVQTVVHSTIWLNTIMVLSGRLSAEQALWFNTLLLSYHHHKKINNFCIKMTKSLFCSKLMMSKMLMFIQNVHAIKLNLLSQESWFWIDPESGFLIEFLPNERQNQYEGQMAMGIWWWIWIWSFDFLKLFCLPKGISGYYGWRVFSEDSLNFKVSMSSRFERVAALVQRRRLQRDAWTHWNLKQGPKRACIFTVMNRDNLLKKLLKLNLIISQTNDGR